MFSKRDGTVQKSKTQPRPPALRTNRPSPTWVPPIPHSLILSLLLPGCSVPLELGGWGRGGQCREFSASGLFDSGGGEIVTFPTPLCTFILWRRTQPLRIFFFRFELRFIFAFHPISSWKFDENRLLVFHSELSVLYIYRVVVVGMQSVLLDCL